MGTRDNCISNANGGTSFYRLTVNHIISKFIRMGILMDKVSRGDFIKEGSQWDSLSPNAKDFVLRLLEVDVNKRLSSEEAINH